MQRLGKIYAGKPLLVKTRRALHATVEEHQRKDLRADNGNFPDD